MTAGGDEILLGPEPSARGAGVAVSALVVVLGAFAVWAGAPGGAGVPNGWILILVGAAALVTGVVLGIGLLRWRLVLTVDEAVLRGMIGGCRIPRRAILAVTGEPGVVWTDASGRRRTTPLRLFALVGGRGTPLPPRILAENRRKLAVLERWAEDAGSAVREPPMPAGELLPGLSADGWQRVALVTFGVFLADLLLVVLTAKAFHPEIPDAVSVRWGIVFILVGLPTIVVLVTARRMRDRVVAREAARGYTTLRLIDTELEVRDGRGLAIPQGDPRLAESRELLRSLAALAPTFLLLSGLFWMLRLLVER